jgi:acyl-CoA synthetase (NDP forming)
VEKHSPTGITIPYETRKMKKMQEKTQNSFQKQWTENIEKILQNAFGEGRKGLYEHEVYRILGEIGIHTPTYIFIQNEKDITNQILSIFGSGKIVLKAVSSKIIHKQKSGGVKVVLKDLDFVKYSFSRMMSFFSEKGIEPEGILLVEHIDYSKDLGNEILLGFRESESFGPVISFSKGGTDAEHFASNFSAPNLILPPLNREWASALQSSTHIQKKYLDEGKTHYITKIIDTELKLSVLSTHFSNFFEFKSGFVLKEFEINPFVFDSDDRFLAIDGYATFEKKDTEPVNLELLPMRTLKSLFEPVGIAVIGISLKDSSKAGNIIVKNLLDLHRDDIYCVNKKGGHITVAQKRFELYTSVRNIENPVDLAIITVPAESTIPVVEDCAKKRVKSIILIPGGFFEVKKNRDIELKILEICRRNGIRVMGPNCLGVMYAGGGKNRGINTFFIPEKKFMVNLDKKKNVAVLSQSGALGITEIFNLRNAISPRVIVSYGNQLDVDPSDLVQYFEKDRSVDVIGLYIEGFKKGAGRKFFNTTAE